MLGFSVPALRGAGRSRPRRCCPVRALDHVGAELATCTDVKSAVEAVVRVFDRAGVSEAVPNAEYIVGCVLGIKSRPALRASFTRALQPAQIERIQSLTTRRAVDREPIQYIVGDWDFHDLTLLVRSPVLIPRPETEELVELVLSSEHFRSKRPCRLLDVGVGSGAILLALLNADESATGSGLDVSEYAIRLARENAQMVGVSSRADFHQVGIEEFAPSRPYDLLVSNPPYIPDADMLGLDKELLLHEDHGALRGGGDGADVIRAILRRAVTGLLKPGAQIWLEVDPSHPELISRWCADHEDPGCPQLRYIETFRDFRGLSRFCHLSLQDPQFPP